MVYDVTTSWAMIHHLDNSESAGPKSVTASEEWRRRKKAFLQNIHQLIQNLILNFFEISFLLKNSI